MRRELLCVIVLSSVGLNACASHTSAIPPTQLSEYGDKAPQLVAAPQAKVPSVASPPPSAVPSHVHGAMAWYEGGNLNMDISGTWMAQHYDITEQGDAGGAFANSFMAAGGKYAIDYSDPEIVPLCNSPFATVNGAKPGTCAGPLSPNLNGVESAWLHDAKGNRLHVTAYGTQTQGNWQDRVNPSYSGLASAYHAWESSLLPGTRWNAFEIDDFQSGYVPSYFTYKFGARSREFDALGANANATWLAAQEKIIAAAPKPVFLNGILSYNMSKVVSLPNVLGVMLESCATTTNTTGIVGSTWIANMNELLQVTALNRRAVCINYGTTLSLSTAQRIYGLASWWLTYNANYSANLIDIPTADGHEVYPEHGIMVYAPLTTATSNNITTLRTSTGVYLREFTYCYVNKVAIGACAAEVNIDGVSHTLPATHFKYAHYLKLTTTSWYKGGAVSWTAGTFTTLPAHTARIVKI